MGRLPQDGWPAPKELLPAHDLYLQLLNACVFLNFPAILFNAIYLITGFSEKTRLKDFSTFFYAGNLLLLLLCLKWDPFEFLNWFFE